MNEKKSSSFLSRIFAPSVSTLKSRRDVQGLVALLADRNWKKASEAAVALGELGDSQATEALIATMRSESGASVDAANALGKLCDRRAVDPLIGLLESNNDALRRAAVAALGKMADPRVVPALMTLVADPKKTSAKPEAAMTLGLMGVFEAVDRLTSCLSDTDYELRSAAAMALVALYATDRKKIPNVDSIVTSLIAAFEKEEKWSTLAAMAQALGSFADTRAIPLLIRKVRTWNIARALEAGRAVGAGLSSLGASRGQVSTYAMQPINALLAVAGALANLGKNADYIAEMLQPALRGLAYESETAILAQIRKQAASVAAQHPRPAAPNAKCDRCGKLLELEPLDPSDALQAVLPRTYLGTICDVCSKVECYQCRGGVGRPCSWCGGHASPAYVAKFAKS